MRNLLKSPFTALTLCLALLGASAPAGAGLLSAKGDVIAIVNGELFLGEAEGHLDGAGTLAIHSQRNPSLTCAGKFTSSAELGGKGKLHCSDGSGATFKFKRLDLRRGHGDGKFTRGPMTFAYGLSAEKAAPYLTLPKGKKLANDGSGLVLVSR
jgi:hypothetical protein